MHPKILVIRLSSLGDIVLTGPIYKNLKSHWPECRISVLVKPQYVPVLEGNPCVDEVIAFRGLWDALRRIREAGFTHLLDLHSTFRSLLLGRLSGIPHRLRYRKDALARRLRVAWRLPSPALTKHTIDRYLDCLSAWNVPTPMRGLELGDYRAPREEWPAPRRVLVVQTAFLGDATLTLPLAREIKRLLPDCRLTVLARHDTADMYRSSSWVDETLCDFKKGEHAGMRGLLRLTRALRAGRFDLALVPHRSLRSAMVVWLAGIPRRIGFSSSAGSFLFTRTIPFAWGMHDLERNLGLLLPLGAAGDPARRNGVAPPTHPPFSETADAFATSDQASSNDRVSRSVAVRAAEDANPKPPADHASLPAYSGDFSRPARAFVDSTYLHPRRTGASAEEVSRRLVEAELPPGSRLIGVHPGSVWPTKRWPEERFAALTGRLAREADASIVLVGGPGDKPLAARVATAAGVPALDWTGTTDLSGLIELMPYLSLFITNDSGPMHVATASGVPTLAIFGPTTRELGFFPYGPRHRVIETDLTCRPCGLHGSRACPEGHFLCMRLISVDQVFQEAMRMLSAGRVEIPA